MTTSLEFAIVVVKMDISEHTVTTVTYEHISLQILSVFKLLCIIFNDIFFFIMNDLSLQFAERGITADTVPKHALLLVRLVDTQTECVPVKRGGRVQDVLKVRL